MEAPRAGQASAASDAARARESGARVYGRGARKSETCLFQQSGERAYLDELAALLRADGNATGAQHSLDILWLSPADLRWLDVLLAAHYFDLDDDLVEFLSCVLRWGRQCRGPVQLVRRRKSGTG